LSRHGARDPTASKTAVYNKTVSRIHESATAYGPGFEFIKDYEYTLAADQLTAFGAEQLVNSGIKFYSRYRSLARKALPFVRSSGQDRVIESAVHWTEGFHGSRVVDDASDTLPYTIVTIPEGESSNNTLDHSLCTSFEDGEYSSIGDDAQDAWLQVFAPAITAKLNKNLPGVNFTNQDTIYFMDLCPFNTVVNGTMSPFCDLFTLSEWNDYSYYQSVGKWYGYGPGNPLGPTQGVGFANELIARLTGQPVADRTSTNSTLDGSPATFPLDRALYADFSHDNDMTAIYAALGLYNATAPLSMVERQTPRETMGYAAAWTAPFAGRMYVEKMTCGGDGAGEELVRVLVNDRVVPLLGCGADELGRCKLGEFVESLSFVRDGGHWDMCFV